jgi:hypothetical protein
MKECPNCEMMLKPSQNFCPECGYIFKDETAFDEMEEEDFEIYDQDEVNEMSYGRVVLTRVQFRLMNTLSFVIPPLGVIFFLLYSRKNNVQAGFFIFWGILGVLLYLGVIGL